MSDPDSPKLNTRPAGIFPRGLCWAREWLRRWRTDRAQLTPSASPEAVLRDLFATEFAAVLVLSAQGKIQYLNQSAAQLLDAAVDHLLGEVFPFAVERGMSTEFEIPCDDGAARWLGLRAESIQWEGAAAELVTLVDLTAQHVSEESASLVDARVAGALDLLEEAVLTLTEAGRIEQFNAAAAQLIGVTRGEAKGRVWTEVLELRDPETNAQLQDFATLVSASFPKEQTQPRVLQLRRDPQQYLPVSVVLREVPSADRTGASYSMVLRDAATVAQAEAQLLKSDQLESLSLLAGGIAHDFNNILTAVLGNVSVVRARMDAADPQAEQLLAAEKAALQAKSLTRQLLSLAKGGSPILEAATIDQIVEDAAQFILRGAKVSCTVEKDEGLWPVEVDKGQIAQVINNLVINANQAMPNGGELRVSLRNRTYSAGAVNGLQAGDYVRIRVADAGVGIAAKDLGQIFTPYFTTKPEGSGLGLASSAAIIQKHGGRITVESELGKGTCFDVYLPRSAQELEPTSSEAVSTETLHKGSGRILVMDDMEAMMRVAGEILEVLGYRTHLTCHGEEAIEAYKAAKESGEPFDAVVFDLTVPGGMGGEEACQILRAYDPDLVAIASSGYTNSDVMSDYESAGFKAVVPKPYRIKEMSRTLHRLLN